MRKNRLISEALSEALTELFYWLGFSNFKKKLRAGTIESFMRNSQQEKITEIVGNADRPISIQQVAKELNISWGTARATLLSLALEGEVRGIRTDKGWIFFKGDFPWRS